MDLERKSVSRILLLGFLMIKIPNKKYWRGLLHNHVSVDTWSDTWFVKAFKKNNYLMFFQSDFSFEQLRSSDIQKKYDTHM